MSVAPAPTVYAPGTPPWAVRATYGASLSSPTRPMFDLTKILTPGAIVVAISEVQKAEAEFNAGASAAARIRVALTAIQQRTGLQTVDAVLSHPEFLGAIATGFEQVAAQQSAGMPGYPGA